MRSYRARRYESQTATALPETGLLLVAQTDSAMGRLPVEVHAVARNDPEFLPLTGGSKLPSFLVCLFVAVSDRLLEIAERRWGRRVSAMLGLGGLLRHVLALLALSGKTGPQRKCESTTLGRGATCPVYRRGPPARDIAASLAADTVAAA